MFFSTPKETLYNFEPQDKPSYTTKLMQASMMTQEIWLDNALEISTRNKAQ